MARSRWIAGLCDAAGRALRLWRTNCRLSLGRSAPEVEHGRGGLEHGWDDHLLSLVGFDFGGGAGSDEAAGSAEAAGSTEAAGDAARGWGDAARGRIGWASKDMESSSRGVEPHPRQEDVVVGGVEEQSADAPARRNQIVILLERDVGR